MRKIIRRQPQHDVLTIENMHPLLKRIYAARGVQHVAELERGLENLLPYADLTDIDRAVNCLTNALMQQQHILIIGDYDADGATSTALAVSALKSFGAKQVSYLVPNRFEYGYGLTPEIVDVAVGLKPNLLITVDNGIASIDGVAAAKALGLQVLITDHHLPGDTLPDADAIVNPNQQGDKFASKHLAGVGVIFYVMLALRSHLRSINWFAENNIAEPNMAQFLDLVALGTVADVAMLDKNNRILVQQGLNRIRAGKARAGIAALLEISGRSYKNLMASDLGFAIGPRLNAAGRLDDMTLGISCLLSEETNLAREIAVELDTLNRERQVIEADMQLQAQKALVNLNLQKQLSAGLCLYDENWHQGVVGILASRIKDQLHRPVIAFAKINDTEMKGSGRSIPGLHIRDVIANIATRYPELVKKFGGHAMAAGVSLAIDNFADFKTLFAEEVAAQLNEDELYGKVISDGELAHHEFDLSTAEMLRAAGPWGQGFEEPIFDGHFHLLQQRLVGQRHLKMTLNLPDTKVMLDAIAFNINPEQWPNHRCQKIVAAYRLDINEFRGQRNLQLIIEHFEPVS